MRALNGILRVLSAMIICVVWILFWVIAINVVGFVVAGGRPGYDSAQGGGTFYFLLSLVLGLPLGVASGTAATFYLARKRGMRAER